MQVSTSPIPFSDGHLEKHVSTGLLHGAHYFSRAGFERNDVTDVETVWLCPVTLLVFWKYPKKIYYKVDNTRLEDRQLRKSINFAWLYGKEGKLADLSLA